MINYRINFRHGKTQLKIGLTKKWEIESKFDQKSLICLPIQTNSLFFIFSMEKLIIDDHQFLERLNLSHVEAIFNAINQNRKFLRKWLPFVDFTHKIIDTERFVRSILEKTVSERDEVYAIWYKHEFAGLIGFKDADRINDKIEIGYWLVEKMTGKGIATEATRKMVNLAFRNMNMNRVQIRCGVGNDKSSAIPRRLGFSFEGIERSGERHNHLYIDLEVYSLLRTEWAKTLF